MSGRRIQHSCLRTRGFRDLRVAQFIGHNRVPAQVPGATQKEQGQARSPFAGCPTGHGHDSQKRSRVESRSGSAWRSRVFSGRQLGGDDLDVLPFEILSVDAADELSCRPNFGILIYPAYLVDRKKRDKLFPEIKITKETPPCFFAHTGDDGVPAEGSVLMYLELEKLG